MTIPGTSSSVPAQFAPDWIERLDKRTTLARAVTSRLDSLETDLGGREGLSYQQRSLAKRIVWLEAVIEQREAALARGDEIDEGKHTQSVNALVGLLKAVGLDRKARPVAFRELVA